MSNHNINIFNGPTSPRLRRTNSREFGFSLVEMLIVAPIVILMIGIFVSAIVSMTGDVLSTRGSNALAFNVQDALDRIAADVKLSGGLLATNNIPLSAPQGYNNDTTNFHNADATNGTMLILNTYATTNNPQNSTQSLLYMSGQPYACNSTQIKQNPPVMFNIVYFIKNSTLWRRVIAPANYATVGCVGGSVGVPWQQPSCYPGISGTICKTQDQKLVEGVAASGFSINYYSSPNTTTVNSIAGDNTKSDSIRSAALQTTGTVSVTITATGKVAGRDISQTGTVREISPNNNTSATGDVTWSSFGTMQNNWIDYSTTYYPNGYRKTKDGLVLLRGLLKRSSGIIVGGEVIGNLPVGYRPSEQLLFQTSSNDAPARVDVLTNGNVIVVQGPGVNPVWLSLDSIRFLASDAPVTFTNATMAPNWTTYGSPFPPASSAVDADGRVFVKGLIARNAVVADPTTTSTLPVGARPSEQLLLPVNNNSGFGFIRILADGSIQATNSPAGTGYNWLTIQSTFYQSSYTNWIGLTMQGTWAYYGAPYTMPQYTKSSDGVVTLKGLIRNGTIGTTVATLPVGYRPNYRILFSTVSNSVYGRLDIDASGNIIAQGGNTAWYSLDGIMFYADQ